MELEVELSSLQITRKKRRVSGIHRRPKVQDQFQEEDSEAAAEELAPRRSGRVRNPIPVPTFIPPPPVEEPKPPLDFEKDLEEIKKIYLNRTVKRHQPSLETIFEDPIKDKMMSARKFRRVISFDCSTAQAQAQKVKKRMLKITKITAHNRIQKKTTMKAFMKRLSKIEDAE